MFEKWNAQVKPWLQVPSDKNILKDKVAMVFVIAALRSNLAAAVTLGKSSRETLKNFDKHWQIWRKKIAGWGYEIFPQNFGKVSTPSGNIIYCCSQKVTDRKNILLTPGVKKKNQIIHSPTIVSILPVKQKISDHIHRELSAHWRGILGELELLLAHLEIQSQVYCGMESIDRNKIIPVKKRADAIIREIKRRGEVLSSSLKKDNTSNYQIITNYWRVEECFWSIFHGDGRPAGYSYFEIIRKRAQEWRPIVARERQMTMRNFIPRRDTVSKINKEISGMIVKKKQGAAPGMVIRQLRPAMKVKENNTMRILKGRVVCT